MAERVDLDELEAKARAATEGPWEPSCYRSYSLVYAPALGADFVRINDYGGDNGDEHMADARYIAAANPSVVLALIAEVRAHRSEAESWAAIDAWLLRSASRHKCTIERSAWHHLTLTVKSGDGDSHCLFQGQHWPVVLSSAAEWCRARLAETP